MSFDIPEVLKQFNLHVFLLPLVFPEAYCTLELSRGFCKDCIDIPLLFFVIFFPTKIPSTSLELSNRVCKYRVQPLMIP